MFHFGLAELRWCMLCCFDLIICRWKFLHLVPVCCVFGLTCENFKTVYHLHLFLSPSHASAVQPAPLHPPLQTPIRLYGSVWAPRPRGQSSGRSLPSASTTIARECSAGSPKDRYVSSDTRVHSRKQSCRHWLQSEKTKRRAVCKKIMG